jgi:hypothetical protein
MARHRRRRPTNGGIACANWGCQRRSNTVCSGNTPRASACSVRPPRGRVAPRGRAATRHRIVTWGTSLARLRHIPHHAPRRRADSCTPPTAGAPGTLCSATRCGSGWRAVTPKRCTKVVHEMVILYVKIATW